MYNSIIRHTGATMDRVLFCQSVIGFGLIQLFYRLCLEHYSLQCNMRLYAVSHFGGYKRLLHIDCSAVIFETYSTTSIKLLRQLFTF
jgi:hypothetical protein